MNKIEIEDDNVTISGPLIVNSLNVGTSLTNHGTAISTIQGNISTINTNVSNFNSNKQNNITLLGGTNVTVTESPTDTWTINSSAGSNLLGTNIISVFNGSINLTSNIPTDNCSLINFSADEIISGLARINGTYLACFGNINRPNEPAITQSSGGVVTINSYANYIYLKKTATNGSSKSLYFTGDALVMYPVKIGGINGDAVFSNINHFNILNFALAQNGDGQT